MGTMNLDNTANRMADSAQALALAGAATSNGAAKQGKLPARTIDPAAYALPGALATVWRGFAAFEAGSKKDGKLTRADLQQVVLKQPRSPAAAVAQQILSSPALLKQFDGVSRSGVLAKIGAMVQAHFAYLDGSKKDGITWSDVTKARGQTESMDWNTQKQVRQLLAQNKDVFQALAGKDNIIQMADLKAILQPPPPASSPVVRAAVTMVSVWNAFDTLDAGSNGKRDGAITRKDLNDLVKKPGVATALKALATKILADPKLLASVAGADGAVSRTEVRRAVAVALKDNFKALDINKVGDGIAVADIKVLSDPRTGEYKRAGADTRALAKALASSPSLVRSLSGGKPTITMTRLDALLVAGTQGRDLRAVAADALARFNKLDVSGNKSVSMAELTYILVETKPNAELAKLVREVAANFSKLSGGDKTITTADLQRIAGFVPR